MTSKIFMLGCVVTPDGQINQIQDFALDPGVQTLLHCGDGKVDYDYAAVLMQSPTLGFSTTAIAKALDQSAFSGLAIAAATDFWFQQADEGGTRKTGADSMKVTGSKGILIPLSLDAGNDGPATIQYQLAVVSTDGTTAPLAVATAATMPTLDATNQAFVCGDVFINGTEVEGVESISVDFGLSLIGPRGSNGQVYPTYVAIRKRRPTITIRTTAVDVAAAASLAQWEAQGTTDSAVFLRKIAEGGTRVADATAEHIGFTIDDGIISHRTIGGGGEADEQVTEILIEPVWDGTNAVVVLSTATAIAAPV